jgi:hypothetical protein
MSPAQAEAYITLSREWSLSMRDATINAVQLRFGLSRAEAERTARDAERRSHQLFNERLKWPATGTEARDYR